MNLYGTNEPPRFYTSREAKQALSIGENTFKRLFRSRNSKSLNSKPILQTEQIQKELNKGIEQSQGRRNRKFSLKDLIVMEIYPELSRFGIGTDLIQPIYDLISRISPDENFQRILDKDLDPTKSNKNVFYTNFEIDSDKRHEPFKRYDDLEAIFNKAKFFRSIWYLVVSRINSELFVELVVHEHPLEGEDIKKASVNNKYRVFYRHIMERVQLPNSLSLDADKALYKKEEIDVRYNPYAYKSFKHDPITIDSFLQINLNLALLRIKNRL